MRWVVVPGTSSSPVYHFAPLLTNYRLEDIRGDASQPNAVQDLIMQCGCPIVLGSCDEGVGLSMATIAVHIPVPCTAGVQ
jgi:hypothetical protein